MKAAGDPEEDRERAAAFADREGRDDDRQRRREHQRRPRPLDDAEDDDPGLCRAPVSGVAPQRPDAVAKITTPITTILPVPGDVGEPPSEGE